jgi:adenosylmethionine-8-amino-7-oxononanoate aminotransferase
MASSSNVSEHPSNYSFQKDLNKVYPIIVHGEGNFLTSSEGKKFFDAANGAGVSCLGYGDKRVNEAIIDLLKAGTPYVGNAFFRTPVEEKLSKNLIDGTGGKMDKVFLTGSGSEAMEIALKLSRQFFFEKDINTPRVNYIARENSYHGNTLGALAVSGIKGRKAPYMPFMMKQVHHVSSCYRYRQSEDGETDATFVARKVLELENKFQELGPETVIAFIAEPVVGAALGCVPSVMGYLQAMKEVCHKHGALFILDEVMCGMGRTGYLHAWQAENVVPDIQTMGKGLGAGYMPIAAVLVEKRVVNVLKEGTGKIVHGQTYQAMPIQAAAALSVQQVIKKDNLLENVETQGRYLGEQLQKIIGIHKYVGDIRGRGLFWGIEFVKDKNNKEPFDPKLRVAQQIQDLALSTPYCMTVYMGTGSVDGLKGDHIMVMPSYNITRDDVDKIIKRLHAVLLKVLGKL